MSADEQFDSVLIDRAGSRKNNQRKKRRPLVFFARLVLAVLCIGVPLAFLLWIGPDYYARWVRVTRLMEQVSSNGYHQLYGASSGEQSGRPLLTSYLDSIWEIRFVQPLSKLPPELVSAVMLAEDKRFFAHPGVDYKGVTRAALVNAQSGAIRQGGSTITQQLVKTFMKRTGRTYHEKMLEALIAVHIELLYSKNDILSAYLNNVYMGHIGSFGLHGVAAASRYYFGKKVESLSPGECAMLAVMIRSPNRLSPVKNTGRNLVRALKILSLMKQQGRLAEAYLFEPEPDGGVEAEAARRNLLAMAWAWQELERELKSQKRILSRSGGRVVIEFSVDPLLQQKAAILVAEQLRLMEQRQKKPVPLQGAMVMIEQETGGVKAIVGGRDYLKSQYNRASRSERPVGSLIKPFVYLAAMETGSRGRFLTPSTLVADTPMRVKTASGSWRPMNYDRRYLGTITAEEALVRSRNIPAVRIGQQASIGRVARLVATVGINDNPETYPSLFLGACSSNVLRMAAAYAALAHGGIYVAPQLIDRVIVGDTVVLLRRPRPVQVLEKKTCQEMTTMLTKVLVSGTGRSAKRYGLVAGLAGKTGTSSNMKDAWFAGYSKELTTVVWVGNDDNRPINMTGAEAALPIWALSMKKNKVINQPVVRQQDVMVAAAERLRPLVIVSERSVARKKIDQKIEKKEAVRTAVQKTTPSRERRKGAADFDQPLVKQRYKFFK